MTDETTLTPQTPAQVPAAPQAQTDLSVSDFAKRIKTRFPAYQELDDYDLANRVLSKHPQYGKVLAYDPKLVGIAESDVLAARQRAEQAKSTLQAAQTPSVTPQVTKPVRRNPLALTPQIASQLSPPKGKSVNRAVLAPETMDTTREMLGLQPNVSRALGESTEAVANAKAPLRQSIGRQVVTERNPTTFREGLARGPGLIEETLNPFQWGKSEEQLTNEEVERRVAQAERAQSPEMIERRKGRGALPSGVAGSLRAVDDPSARALAGIGHTAAGVMDLFGLLRKIDPEGSTKDSGWTPLGISNYLHDRARILEESTTNAPLTPEGEEIQRSLGEKAVATLGDLGLGVAQIIALKKATGLPLGRLLAIETALKTSDQPASERAPQVAESYGLGKLLEGHLSRGKSAAAFAVPSAIHQAPGVLRGTTPLSDAALQVGLQAAMGGALGGGKGVERPVDAEVRPEPVKPGDRVRYSGTEDGQQSAGEGEVVSASGRTEYRQWKQVARKAGIRDFVVIKDANGDLRVMDRNAVQPKPHHSELQPRNDQGQFNGPPEAPEPVITPPSAALNQQPEAASPEVAEQPMPEAATSPAPDIGERRTSPRTAQTDLKFAEQIASRYGARIVEVSDGTYRIKTADNEYHKADTPQEAIQLLRSYVNKNVTPAPEASPDTEIERAATRDYVNQFKGDNPLRNPSYPTVPERPETIAAQLEQRGFALVPEGQHFDIPEGYQAEKTADGTVYYDPARIDAETIRNTPTQQLLGHIEEKSPVTTETVVTRNPDGTEYQSSAVSPENQTAQVELSQANALEGATVETGGPEKAAEVLAERQESTTSARKSQMAEDRAGLDLPDLPPVERKSWQRSLDNAREKGLPERALSIARNVLERPHALDDEQTAGLVQRAQQIKNEHAEVMRQIAAESNTTTLTDLRAHAEELQDQFDTLSDALKQSGSEKGRALAAQKLTINQDYDLVSLLNRYKQKVGKPPTDEVRATIERQAATIKDLQDRLAERESRLANEQISRSTERIRREVSRETRRAQRGAKKADLDAEAAQIRDLIAQAWKKSRQPNIQPSGLAGLDPEGEIAKLVLKLVRNRVQANLGIKAEALVDEVHGLLEKVVDIDKRDIREMITSYGKPRQRQSELQRNLNSLKGQLRKGLEDEDTAAGRRSGKPEGPPNVLREIQKRNARLERQIAELERKATESDFGGQPKPATPTYSDSRTQQLTEELSRAKLDYERKLRQWEDTNRSMPEKTADLLIKWGRAAKLSYISTLGKLGSAATGRMVMSPLENLIGEIPHRLMPKLSAKATIEGGGFSRAAEVAALWKSGRLKQVLNQLTKGSSNLDIELGPRSKLIDKEMSGEGILGIPGRAHGALKEYPRQAEFDRAFLKVLKNHERAGQDITQPATQIAARMEAFNAAERARFQQRNIISDTFNNAMSSLERKGLGGKLIAKPAKFLFPIVRVPVNVAGETLNYTFGLPRAVIETAIRGGIEKLTPEQANNIMRAYKKGGLGLAVMTYAFLHPEQFGGHYQKNDKRKPSEPKPGEIMFFGKRIPKALTHIPILEAAQMGATARRVMDGLTAKGEGKTDTAITAGGAALGGVAEGVPFYETPARFFQGKEGSRGTAQLAGEQARGMIPGFIQEGAKYLDKGPSGDTVTRRPSGSFAERFKQTVQLGIPGPYGRTSVPIGNVFGTKSTKASDEVQRLNIPLVGAVRQADESPEDFAKREPIDNAAVRKGIERVVNLRAYDKLTDEEKADQIKLAKQEALKEIEHPEKPEKPEKRGLLPDESPAPPLVRRGLRPPPNPYRRFRQVNP